MTATQVHVVKKGDSLSKIAKKYGIKDWKKGLYEHPSNKGFKKKFPNPNRIVPGEKLQIPAAEEPMDKAVLRFRSGLPKLVKLNEDLIAHLKRSRADIEARFKKSAESAERVFKKMEKWSEGVDQAATLINLGRSMTSLAGQTGKAMKGTAEQTAKIAKQLSADMKEGLAMKGIGLTATAIKAAPAGDSTAWLVTKEVAKAWCDIGSPSFWAHTIVQISKGKSWSDAVKHDPKRAHQKAMTQGKQEKARALEAIDMKIATYQAHLKELRTALRALE